MYYEWKYKLLVFLMATALLAGCSSKPTAIEERSLSMIVLRTNKGEIEVELFAEQAPETVKNFLAYVDNGFYNGTIFHRVIDGFMIQGGGFTPEMRQKPTQEPVENEATNGLTNDRGTLAMARTSDVNSATTQFFINVTDNDFLNHRDRSASGFGYCVFGRVTRGMDVVDRIKAVATGTHGPFENVPLEPVVIQEAVRIDAPSAAK